MDRVGIRLFVLAVVLIIGAVLFFNTFSWTRVEGNEAMIEQYLFKGVLDKVKLSGTHFYCGWLSDMYVYDIGTQKITFDNAQRNKNADYPRIKVNLGEEGGQSAWISLSANYRVGWDDILGSPKFNPLKLVALHKDGIGKTYEDVVVKRTIIDIVNKISRPRRALEIYSGIGFVKFKEDVNEELKSHPVFRQRGIFVENIIVYQVELEPKYESEIEAKQLAIQTRLRKLEETKAAEEEARRAFAEAQAMVEKRRQEAEAKKIEAVLKAEAEKQKRVLEAEGERDANIAKADGILARGKAEAEVDALKREALYGGASGAWRARVQIAEKRAEKLKGIFAGVQIVPEKTILRIGEPAGVASGVAVEIE